MATGLLAPAGTHRLPTGLEEDAARTHDLHGPWVVGFSGLCQAVAGSPSCTVTPCQAYSGGGGYIWEDRPRTLPLPAGDGLYWVGLTATVTTPPGGLTRLAGTHLAWVKQDAPPAADPGLVLLSRVTVSGGAVTLILDCAPRRFTAPVTLTQALTTHGLSVWDMQPGALLTYTGQTVLHEGSVLAHPAQPLFRSGGTGSLQCGPKVWLSPAWFAASGTGTRSDPWQATDGTGGLKEALHALRDGGNLRAAPGVYHFTASTPAQLDGFTPNSSLGNLTLDWSGATLLVQAPASGSVIDLNPGADPGSASTDVHTITWRGGFLDVGDEVTLCTIEGLRGNAVRNLLIERVRFRGISHPVVASVSDTLHITDCFFRRYQVAIDLPDYFTLERGVLDVAIDHNSGSSNVDGCIFVRANTYWHTLQLRANGVAQTGTSDASRLFTGWSGKGSNFNANLVLDGNRLEQQTHGKGIEITTHDGRTARDLRLVSNELLTALTDSAVPFLIHLEDVRGGVTIANNVLHGASNTGVRVEHLRASGILAIHENEFRQTGTGGGTALNIVNVYDGAQVLIGLNDLQDFYLGDMPGLQYDPNRSTFVPLQQFPQLPSAPTLTLAPWTSHVILGGTATVTTLTVTWRGHQVSFKALASGLTFQDGVGNLLLAGAWTPVGNDTLLLACDGINWVELSRSAN